MTLIPCTGCSFGTRVVLWWQVCSQSINYYKWDILCLPQYRRNQLIYIVILIMAVPRWYRMHVITLNGKNKVFFTYNQFFSEYGAACIWSQRMILRSVTGSRGNIRYVNDNHTFLTIPIREAYMIFRIESSFWGVRSQCSSGISWILAVI